MRKLLIVLLLAALWSACSREHPEKIAAQAAKECYDLLLDGKYDEFIARKANTDSIPASYREQLVANMNGAPFGERVPGDLLWRQYHRGDRGTDGRESRAVVDEIIQPRPNRFLAFLQVLFLIYTHFFISLHQKPKHSL